MFEHFQYKVFESEKYIYFIDTHGFAFKKDKDTGLKIILNPELTEDKQIKVRIGKSSQLLAPLIYFTIFDRVEKKQVVKIDQAKNYSIDNLANLSLEEIEKLKNKKMILAKNNNTGKCKLFREIELLTKFPIYLRLKLSKTRRANFHNYTFFAKEKIPRETLQKSQENVALQIYQNG